MASGPASKASARQAPGRVNRVEPSTSDSVGALYDDIVSLRNLLTLTGTELAQDIQQILSKLEDITGHCNTPVQAAKVSIRDSVKVDPAAAASDTSALIIQRTDPLNQRLSILEANFERRERIHKATSMIMKGFSPPASLPRWQLTDSILQLLKQHASKSDFAIISATVFGNATAGPKPIRVVFPSSDDKHAAYTASQRLRSQNIYLEDDLTPFQLQQRQTLMHIHRQLRQRQLHPFWRGTPLH